MVKIESIWYGSNPLKWVLMPVSGLFSLLVKLRRACYRWGVLYAYRLPVPVIVVGNITAGGTGKTPLTLWLVDFLREQGYKPGIISRGYGGTSTHWPQLVSADSDSEQVGDEAVLLATRAGCPMAVGPDRVAAGELLLNESDCNIILSDDGLQHYRLERDVEIAVVDGIRREGNGLMLPAGPLREPIERLASVDAVVVNGGRAHRGEFAMCLQGRRLENLSDSEWTKDLAELAGKQVHALAGIGNPGRFFTALQQAGLDVIEHPFPDHHRFTAQDVQFDDFLPVLMTEKDAVKCRGFASERMWVLPVSATLGEVFARRLITILSKRTQNG